MSCHKMRLREKVFVECGICYGKVDQCDDCGDESIIGEDWWCYSDGDKHYCDDCWNLLISKR